MRVLVACEFSGIVRDAFRARGHEAWSCDLLPTERPGPHIVGDVLNHLESGKWDLMIAHPPCTYLTNSGVRWLYEIPGRWEAMHAGAEFFKALLEAPIPKIAVENPIMHGHARDIVGQKQTQTIQPWQFGHREMKATCLWLKNLPLLHPTDIVGPPPKDKALRKEWARIAHIPPGPDRWKIRSLTYDGIARAMASQWGDTL